jgi:hypothetical protein
MSAGMIDEGALRASLSEEVQHLQSIIADRDKELKEYRKDHGRLESLFRGLRETVTPLAEVPAMKRPARVRDNRTPSTALIRISDGHHGAVQQASEIEGINAYSPAISRARQLGFVADACDWVERHRAAYPIPDAAVIVTGDLISGDIHEELRVTNAYPAPVQAIRAGELLADQIAALAGRFESVVVHFVVEDNHGRLSKKPQAKEAGMNTWNYIVGEIARLRLINQRNVAFHVYPCLETVVRVACRQYLISHGHNIRGWGGHPWYGIDRAVGREAQARLQLIMEETTRAATLGFHKYLIGHWHVPVDLPLYDVCPSPSGTDAYDRQQGRMSKPAQTTWLVHHERGEFDRTVWDLRSHDAEAASYGEAATC